MRRAIVLALPLLASQFASAQSVTSSPFGTATPGQAQQAREAGQGRLNALAAWDRLPTAQKTRITAQLATLSNTERLALLDTIPSLRTLDQVSKQALLDEIAVVTPLPVTTVLEAEYVPSARDLSLAIANDSSLISRWGWPFYPSKQGHLDRVEILAFLCVAGDQPPPPLTISIRYGNPFVAPIASTTIPASAFAQRPATNGSDCTLADASAATFVTATFPKQSVLLVHDDYQSHSIWASLESPSASRYYWVGDWNGTAPGSAMGVVNGYFQSGPWQTRDFGFRLWITPTSP